MSFISTIFIIIILDFIWFSSNVYTYLINPSLEIPRFCIGTSQCSSVYANSFCNSIRNHCQCDFGYEPIKKIGSTDFFCKKKSCSIDAQCTSTYGSFSICDFNTNQCVCQSNYFISNQTQHCIRKNETFIQIIPIIPIILNLPPKADVTKLGYECNWNGKTCGDNAICWFNKCICPTGYYPLNSFNCSKIECTNNIDCKVFEPHSYCALNILTSNKCQCLYGIDFSTQRCQKETFYPTYSTTYYSFATLYLFILIVIFLLTLFITILKNCKKQKKISARIHTTFQQPPPPYQTKV